MKYNIVIIQQCDWFEGGGVKVKRVIIPHDKNNVLKFKTIVYNFR